MVYYLIYAVLLLLAFYEVYVFRRTAIKRESKGLERYSHKTWTNIRVILCLFTVFFIAFAGLRWEVGIDFYTYLNAYNNLISGKTDNIEWTFKILSLIVPSLTFIFIFYAFFSVLLTVKVIKDNSQFIFLSLLLFFSNVFLRYDMGIMRQGLALAVTMWALKYAIKRKFFKFIICIFIAVLFHRSAIIFIPAYFIVNIRFSNSAIIIITLVCMILGITDFWKYAVKIVAYLHLPGMDKYLGHLNNSNYINYSLRATDISMLAFLFLFMFIIDRKDAKIGKMNRALLNLYFTGVCIYYLFRPYTTLSDRGSYYYCIYEVLLLPLLLKYVDNKWLRAIVLLAVCLYSFNKVNFFVNYESTSFMNAPYVPYKLPWG